MQTNGRTVEVEEVVVGGAKGRDDLRERPHVVDDGGVGEGGKQRVQGPQVDVALQQVVPVLCRVDDTTCVRAHVSRGSCCGAPSGDQGGWNHVSGPRLVGACVRVVKTENKGDGFQPQTTHIKNSQNLKNKPPTSTKEL